MSCQSLTDSPNQACTSFFTSAASSVSDLSLNVPIRDTDTKSCKIFTLDIFYLCSIEESIYYSQAEAAYFTACCDLQHVNMWRDMRFCLCFISLSSLARHATDAWIRADVNKFSHANAIIAVLEDDSPCHKMALQFQESTDCWQYQFVHHSDREYSHHLVAAWLCTDIWWLSLQSTENTSLGPLLLSIVTSFSVECLCTADSKA